MSCVNSYINMQSVLVMHCLVYTFSIIFFHLFLWTAAMAPFPVSQQCALLCMHRFQVIFWWGNCIADLAAFIIHVVVIDRWRICIYIFLIPFRTRYLLFKASSEVVTLFLVAWKCHIQQHRQTILCHWRQRQRQQRRQQQEERQIGAWYNRLSPCSDGDLCA